MDRQLQAACVLLVLLLTAALQQAHSASDTPLQFAIVNQVHFHLEVVAGAMLVLKRLTSAPVTVYMPAKVIKNNWYGFMSWLGTKEGYIWKDSTEYDGTTKYDLVWFISPEYNTAWVGTVFDQMQPKVAMVMVHNGHIKDDDFKKLDALSQKSQVPLITLAPHVAKYISNRTELQPEWVLPIYPYQPASACGLADLQAGKSCLKGFSVQGRIEKSRRNYTQIWEQISDYRTKEGEDALKNFRLNILGEAVEFFAVPKDVRDLVAVYKNPPYPIFYDVVYHSFGLVPMLASPLYYSSKFSSTVLTSFITGTPIIADKRFTTAYSMIDRNAVYYQDDNLNELDMMFSIARMPTEEMWRTRSGLAELRQAMNVRATGLIVGWLKGKGLVPDDLSEAGKEAAGRKQRRSSRKQRKLLSQRRLLSPLLLLGIGEQLSLSAGGNEAPAAAALLEML